MGLLYPVFVQVALTFFLLFWMGLERYKSVKAGTFERGENKGIKWTWPERAGVVSNAFQNQLEMPMLFYAVIAFALITHDIGTLMVVLAWAFVILRLAHAYIFTTYNFVPHRFGSYLASCFVLALMWIELAVNVIAAGT
jgi:hypothetical protein